jgi:GABA permease
MVRNEQRERAEVDHLLVVANETFAGDAMVEAVLDLVAPGGSVFIVCPTLVSRARIWTSDLTAGMVAARHRLNTSIETLRAHGLEAGGMVGDTDPVLAIEDALRMFPADHLMICVHSPHTSSRRERRTVQRARGRFAMPQSQIVVDLAADARLAATRAAARERAIA